MKHIAIISFYHIEASICLAKYLGLQDNIEVDFYCIADVLRDRGYQSGLDYHQAGKQLGIYHLKNNEIKEIKEWSANSRVSYHLIRVFSFSPKFYWLYKIIIKHAMKKINAKKYDAINLVGQTPWIEYIHDQLLNNNLIHSIHEIGNDHVNSISTSYLDKLIKGHSKIIFYSKYLEERFKKIDIGNLCHITHIPFGIFETTRLYENSSDMNVKVNRNKITFLFYGFIKPYKGLDLLKEAHVLLRNISDQYNLIIAGAGTDVMLSYFRAEDNVEIINRFLSDSEISYLNEIADVVLLPYKSASQSGIVPTSFMYGNPIIATNVGALGENIKDGVNGLLVKPNSSEEFANAMRQVIDKKILSKLKLGALQFGHDDEYDWNNIAKRTLDFYFE